MRIVVPVGTRPEVVKLAPVVAELRRRDHEVRVIATGQHDDPRMADAFFEGLDLRPDVRWSLPKPEPERVGALLAAAYAELAADRPDLVLLLGDTSSVPLVCLAARRHRVPVAHLEAGMRSFNDTSLEEINRKIAAVSAQLHLAPTELAARFLRDEGIADERIAVVGNPILDVLRLRGVRARPLADRAGVVVTAHRATNVDDPERLGQLVDLVTRVASDIAPVTWPMHPRTRSRLDAAPEIGHRLEGAAVSVVEPLPYDDMLDLLSGARLVVTDSGGLQEEASWLGLPAVVLRTTTPRWEGVQLGAAVLVGLDVEAALAAAKRFAEPSEQERIAALPCPYGDGHTSERVADLLDDEATRSLLTIREPLAGEISPL